MQNKAKEELIEIIEKQNKLIAELLNENAEKENMINVLMTEFKQRGRDPSLFLMEGGNK